MAKKKVPKKAHGESDEWTADVELVITDDEYEELPRKRKSTREVSHNGAKRSRKPAGNSARAVGDTGNSLAGPSDLSGLVSGTEFAYVDAGGDPARRAAVAGQPDRKSQKRGAGDGPVRPAHTSEVRAVPDSAGSPPAEYVDAGDPARRAAVAGQPGRKSQKCSAGDGPVRPAHTGDVPAEGSDDEIDDSLIELLDEMSDDLSGGDEAGPGRWEPQVWLSAFLECTDASPLGPAIREMLSECLMHDEATEDVLEFLEDKEPSTWRSHCKAVDKIWEEYAPEFARICECDQAMLVKPSGPLLATLCIQWHYPTFNTKFLGYGMVFDPTNPCLRIQQTKIGTSRRVLTFDTFPVRTTKPGKGREFGDNFFYWTEYCDLAIKFQHEISKHAKLRLVLGKQNWLLVREYVQKQEDVVVTRIPLFVTSGREPLRFYGEQAHLLVVQDKSTMAVKQIIIPSYHAEWLYHASLGSNAQARMMDKMWNGCAAIAGLNSVNSGYFEWKVARNPEEGCGTFVSEIVCLVALEKDGYLTDDKRVRDMFSSWISQNSERLDPAKGSLAKQIHFAISMKGRQTQAEGGWQSLEKGRQKGQQTQAEGGWQNLRKGQQTQAEGGWQNLVKGRRTQAEGGWQNLVKARQKGQQTQAEGGWQSLVKGRQTRAEGGWQSLRKGQQTRAEGGWQSLRKGDATRAASGEKRANARWQAIKDGPLLLWQASMIKSDQNRAKKIAELDGKPWRERSAWMKYAVSRKHITWYSARTPDGLRFEGDGGEEREVPPEDKDKDEEGLDEDKEVLPLDEAKEILPSDEDEEVLPSDEYTITVAMP
ncbi:hypothetical protein OIDMADRAFT_56295 [Oidiodendron maius Zn]|uniref:Uncharacterized protein n=1 Tax=Oidiodendron maius (strain Zn) TaxID=913774 RepID=A0A0C3CJN5_OIDMZ|nr:hypothetical protein OIDMADRAFT_56295 [Oidiodendron maius Zn]